MEVTLGHLSSAHLFVIQADHPALADHFPDNPIVPGALILDEILTGAIQQSSLSLVDIRVAEVKFRSPLKPGQTAETRYHMGPNGLRFEVHSDGSVIASGLIKAAS